VKWRITALLSTRIGGRSNLSCARCLSVEQNGGDYNDRLMRSSCYQLMVLIRRQALVGKQTRMGTIGRKSGGCERSGSVSASQLVGGFLAVDPVFAKFTYYLKVILFAPRSYGARVFGVMAESVKAQPAAEARVVPKLILADTLNEFDQAKMNLA